MSSPSNPEYDTLVFKISALELLLRPNSVLLCTLYNCVGNASIHAMMLAGVNMNSTFPGQSNYNIVNVGGRSPCMPDNDVNIISEFQ